MHHSHRLRKNEEFQLVFQKGKSAANKQFVVYVMPTGEEKPFRVGISVSKKIGNAVIRNRVKRLLKEVFLSIEEQVKAGQDLVVIVRQGVEAMSLAELKSSLVHALKRSKALNQLEPHAEKRG